MLKQIAATHGIHTEEYYQAVIDRERVVDTVVANGSRTVTHLDVNGLVGVGADLDLRSSLRANVARCC